MGTSGNQGIERSHIEALRAGVDDAAVGRRVRELMDSGRVVVLVKRKEPGPLYCASCQVQGAEPVWSGSRSLLFAIETAEKKAKAG